MIEHAEKISFIVVAKNEVFAIRKCLESLVTLESENYEIICVDSSSCDGTLNVMKLYAKKYNFIKVFQIEGSINAAIARNVGISHASGEILFFVDGDTEINHEFIIKSIGLIISGKADAVTGKLKDIYYSDDYNTILYEKDDHHRLNNIQEKKIFFTGGNFVASRKIVSRIGYFDEAMIRNQDIDYTSRLAHVGTFIAVPEDLGLHHTLKYQKRTLQYLLKGYPMFFGKIIRKNLTHPVSLYCIMKKAREISFGLLIYLIAGMFLLFGLSGFKNLNYVVLVMAIILLIDLFLGLIKKQNIFLRCIAHYFYPILIIVGMFYNFNQDPDYKIRKII